MFRFRVWLQNPKCGYQYRNPDFPIKRNPRVCAWRSKIADCWWRWSIFFSDQMGPAHMSRLQLPGFWAYYLRQCKCCTVADPGWISGSGWLSPPPPPYLKVWVYHCCMYCYVFKLLSEPDIKLNCWYSLFKVRLRHGLMRFFGDVPGSIQHKTRNFNFQI